MATLTEKLQQWFAAVAFAEAGEREIALEMIGVPAAAAKDPVGVMQTLSTTFAAAAFAEANCHDMAAEVFGSVRRNETFLETLGLTGARIWYGVAPVEEPSFFEVVGLHGVRIRLGVVSV
jgi:hypothetical protein